MALTSRASPVKPVWCIPTAAGCVAVVTANGLPGEAETYRLCVCLSFSGSGQSRLVRTRGRGAWDASGCCFALHFQISVRVVGAQWGGWNCLERCPDMVRPRRPSPELSLTASYVRGTLLRVAAHKSVASQDDSSRTVCLFRIGLVVFTSRDPPLAA